MRFKKIVKMFEDGNVMVTGLRGTGKDMLTANVVVRRDKPYVSNVDYGGHYIPFVYEDFTVGGNTYKNFLSGDLKYYKFPHPPGTDLYLSDTGVYFPAQYCNELNRDYKQFPVYMALSRQLASGGNVHANVQNLNRCWDKVREQSDQYILCRGCWVVCGWVMQHIRIYELYDSCVRRVPPFRMPKPLFSAERRQRWQVEKDHYEQSYGNVSSAWLLYRNKSKYDTYIFKTMLERGKKNDEKC